MSARRAARERLLQALYAQQMTEVWADPEEIRVVFPQFGDDEKLEKPPPVEDDELIIAVFPVLKERRAELDKMIQDSSRNWRIERMDVVDLCLLRLATAELVLGTAPDRVVINEAVELAKRYGTEESHRFVNGVLDGVLRLLRDTPGRGADG